MGAIVLALVADLAVVLPHAALTTDRMFSVTTDVGDWIIVRGVHIDPNKKNSKLRDSIGLAVVTKPRMRPGEMSQTA